MSHAAGDQRGWIDLRQLRAAIDQFAADLRLRADLHPARNDAQIAAHFPFDAHRLGVDREISPDAACHPQVCGSDGRFSGDAAARRNGHVRAYDAGIARNLAADGDAASGCVQVLAHRVGGGDVASGYRDVALDWTAYGDASTRQESVPLHSFVEFRASAGTEIVLVHHDSSSPVRLMRAVGIDRGWRESRQNAEAKCEIPAAQPSSHSWSLCTDPAVSLELHP